MDEKLYIEKIIDMLEEVLKRPRLVFDQGDRHIFTFIQGFNLACSVLSVSTLYADTYIQIKKEHGWPLDALHPIDHMIRAGMDQREIINTALNLEIETWQRVYQALNDKLST